MGQDTDKQLMSNSKKACEKSETTNVFICDKRPENKRARKAHKKIKRIFKNLKKKAERLKNQKAFLTTEI